MIRRISWFLVPALAIGQTTVAPVQIRSTAAAVPEVLVCLPAGSTAARCVPAKLGAGVSYDATAQELRGTRVLAGVGVACVAVGTDTTCGTDDSMVPFYARGTGIPAIACRAGRDTYVDAAAGKYYICPADNVWEQVGAGGSAVRFRTEDPSMLVAPMPSYPLAETPVAGSVAVFRNGLRLRVLADYTVAGRAVSFAAPGPQAGDLLTFDYRW